MSNIRQLPSGNYFARVYVSPGVYVTATGKTRKAAEDAANKKKYTLVEAEKKTLPTLKEACEKYIAGRESTLSPATLHAYRSITKTNFKAIMGKQVDKITVDDIQKEIKSLAENNKSAKTIKNNVMFINAVLKYVGIELKTDRLSMPKKQKTVYNTPTPEEMQNIITAAKDTDVEVPILIAMWMGLRASEIVALTWDNVSEVSLTVSSAKIYCDGEEHLKSPKTFEGTRTIPMPGILWDKIKKLPRNGEYLFDCNSNALGKRFAKFIKRNNLPKCTFHELRHANASVMCMVGVPDKYAMQRGGWSSPGVYKNIYSQTFTDGEIDTAGKIDAFFAKMM